MGLKLIAWIHTTLGAAAVIPWNPKRQKQWDRLLPSWTDEELACFLVQRPPVFGWSAVEMRVALT